MILLNLLKKVHAESSHNPALCYLPCSLIKNPAFAGFFVNDAIISNALAGHLTLVLIMRISRSARLGGRRDDDRLAEQNNEIHEYFCVILIW